MIDTMKEMKGDRKAAYSGSGVRVIGVYRNGDSEVAPPIELFRQGDRESADADTLRAPLWALVDAAKAIALIVQARETGARAFTLFDLRDEALAMVGPCLLPLDPPSQYADVWENADPTFGVLLATDAPLVTLHRHLRRCFRVTNDAGREFFFRYYDPRVLRSFLPTCDSNQLNEFFGPVGCWFARKEQNEGYDILRVSNGQLVDGVELAPFRASKGG